MVKRITLIGIARFPAAQRQGLKGLRYLAPNHGMLFIFPFPQILFFEMEDVFIPLDLLIIDGEGIVVSYDAMSPNLPGDHGMVEGLMALEVPVGTFNPGVVGSRAIFDGNITVTVGG